ncbi:MAG: Dam family site-specific DNA-(adenine-N6)-methyltransferase [Bacteroidales bacterium]|jgi:DNA adenine methylase|nr:Dam family site-specific DNA-(adenine-N6)-methyltransferase [Bacteroidales bacterium]NCU36027.1 Dam family site-specific DNA-(adenine-N6)-methyltransferase [Candidatus Falkowbacteria bacterium]MDD2633097.1 Dam family site-specific DNA-(adenine-N6)-methyltransferase [Bacteroidales bacterium]MDD3130345.1 Dam family site-specific DNA-(adenine-N6)-methyltransferase [Bacteroidales bacterium]MDD4742524.1 Dam family site-specific DNA-(adenine-N6)-methyltransferase [Bacteroidales bacterium]
MKPLLKYRGGKSREIPHLIKHIPQFSGRYIEPFFGGGALFFHLEPKKAIINDINSKLMAFYLGVKDNFETLNAELTEIKKIYKINRKRFEELKAKTPDKRVDDENEPLYYQIRDMFNDLTEKKYSDAFLYFFINKTAYSGMIRYNAKGEFNVPYGRYANLNTSLVTKAHSNLLSDTEVYNLDYSKIFKMAEENDFMFLDPPYDSVFSDYGNIEYKDGFDENNHIELANQYKRLKCKALMVIGRTPLTEKLYGDMIVDEYGKSYAVNIRNRFKSAANHLLISNYGNEARKRYPQLEFEKEFAQ